MLPKVNRLPKAAFQNLLRSKPVYAQRGVRVYLLQNVIQNTRIGFRIYGKVTAVTRNRTKRRIREYLRILLPHLRKSDIVFVLQYSPELESLVVLHQTIRGTFIKTKVLMSP